MLWWRPETSVARSVCVWLLTLALLLSVATGASARDHRAQYQHRLKPAEIVEDRAPRTIADVLQAIMRHEFWFPQRAAATKQTTTAAPSPAPSPSPRSPSKLPVEPKDAGFSGEEEDQLQGQSGSKVSGEAAVSVWAPTSITQDNVRIALDAVRYRNNYEKYITTRLCLHRINLIRSRQGDDDLTSFLFSVDGCESTKITATGRCDIYYCKLATYELKVTQKTAKKDIYIVQSIFKALSQKSMSELMQPSNLDVTDPTDDGGGPGDDGNSDNGNGNTRERALVQIATKGGGGRSPSALVAMSRTLMRLPVNHEPILEASGSVQDHPFAGTEIAAALVSALAAACAIELVVIVVYRRTRFAQRQRRRRRRRQRQYGCHPLPSPLSESWGLLASGAPSQPNDLGATV